MVFWNTHRIWFQYLSLFHSSYRQVLLFLYLRIENVFSSLALHAFGKIFEVVCLKDAHGVWVVPFSQCFNVDHRGKIRIDLNSYEKNLHKSRIAVQRRQQTPSLRIVHNDEPLPRTIVSKHMLRFVPGEHCNR
jgi:hypothetical protein